MQGPVCRRGILPPPAELVKMCHKWQNYSPEERGAMICITIDLQSTLGSVHGYIYPIACCNRKPLKKEIIMKTLLANRKITVSILTMALLIYGLQGISYGQGEAPDFYTR